MAHLLGKWGPILSSTPQKGDHFPAKCAKINVKNNVFLASRNSEADLPDPAETQHARQNRPWVPHAGGQDDGGLHKLPQIIEYALVEPRSTVGGI